MASKLRVDSILPVDGAPTGGGGGIVQVVQSFDTATSSSSVDGGALTDHVLTQAITPKFSTSKVLVCLLYTSPSPRDS